jgi:hypothetical protein
MLRVEGEKKVLVCLVCLFEQSLFTSRCFYYSPAPYAFQNIHPHFWPFAQGVILLIINYDFCLLCAAWS